MITPVPLLYVKEPSPPASVTDIADLASLSVYCVMVEAITPVLLLYDIPVPALKDARARASV